MRIVARIFQLAVRFLGADFAHNFYAEAPNRRTMHFHEFLRFSLTLKFRYYSTPGILMLGMGFPKSEEAPFAQRGCKVSKSRLQTLHLGFQNSCPTNDNDVHNA